MDIGRNPLIFPAVITALELRHTVFQHLQQAVHLDGMEFPDLVDEQHATIGFTDSAGLGTRNAHLPESPCPLINGVMDRAQKRICNASLVKLQCGGVHLHKFRVRRKRGMPPSFGFLQHQSCRRRFAYTGWAINDDMLGIGAAKSRSEGTNAQLLPHDLAQGLGTSLFRQWLCQSHLPHGIQLFHLPLVLLHGNAVPSTFPPRTAPQEIPRPQEEK